MPAGIPSSFLADRTKDSDGPRAPSLIRLWPPRRPLPHALGRSPVRALPRLRDDDGVERAEIAVVLREARGGPRADVSAVPSLPPPPARRHVRVPGRDARRARGCGPGGFWPAGGGSSGVPGGGGGGAPCPSVASGSCRLHARPARPAARPAARVADARPGGRRSPPGVARPISELALGPPPDLLRWAERAVPPRATALRPSWAFRRRW